jgi:UDP-N-acetylglucosamine--dolichyl-phosphate N-acetylglucosaminephosphotransferase
MVASNLTNMLAGFNGLEASMGIVSAVTISVAALILDKYFVMLIMLPLIGSLAAFMIFNWYPASIFPGDTGALIIGCVIAVAVIIGNMELVGVYVMIIYIINFLMYVFNIKKFLRHNWKFGKVDRNGNIHPPSKEARFGAIYYLLAHYFKLTERKLVVSLISIHILICAGIIASLL